MSDQPVQFSKAAVPGGIILGAVVFALLGYNCGTRKAQDQVATLTTQLAESEKTIELKDGLYSTTIVEMNNLKDLLQGSDAEIAALKKQLSDSQAQLLTTQQVAIKWKNAYEAELTANQSQGSDGRTRVDFQGDLGPIHAQGFTLTDPAEAHLKLDQLRPLVLTVSVAKNKDGKWQSYVTSSEPNMQAVVNLAGVDPGVTSPSWRPRIWVDLGADFIGDHAARAGLSYHFDRWSLGASCSIWAQGEGCGATVGFRLFK